MTRRRLTDIAREQVAAAYAAGDLDALRDLALTAIDDLEAASRAFATYADEVVYVYNRGTAS